MTTPQQYRIIGLSMLVLGSAAIVGAARAYVRADEARLDRAPAQTVTTTGDSTVAVRRARSVLGQELTRYELTTPSNSLRCTMTENNMYQHGSSSGALPNKDIYRYCTALAAQIK